VRRGQGGDGLGPGAGVALKGAQRGVAGLGHEQRQGDVVLGQVCDGGVPQLVQGPAGGGVEDLLGPPVGQACPAGLTYSFFLSPRRSPRRSPFCHRNRSPEDAEGLEISDTGSDAARRRTWAHVRPEVVCCPDGQSSASRRYSRWARDTRSAQCITDDTPHLPYEQ